jgi:hypothetical protein
MIPYRSDSLSADLLFEDLLIERRNDLPAALSQARIRERRVGRIAASTAGVAGGALLMIMTFATFSPTPWRKAIRDLAWYAIEKRSKGLSRRTLLWTVVASAVLGAYLSFIPPVLTGLTGALFVPGMFLFDRRAS